jgi:hypothetical protein
VQRIGIADESRIAVALAALTVAVHRTGHHIAGVEAHGIVAAVDHAAGYDTGEQPTEQRACVQDHPARAYPIVGDTPP